MRIFLILLLISNLALSLSVPSLNKPVTDKANMINSKTERILNSVLQKTHQSGQLQMAVLTIPDLKDETLEGYSIKVVDEWQLGGKESDNGVLLLIAKKQRKIRLEVGQGLEGSLPDAHAKRIIDGMGPYFRSGQVDDGIKFAVSSVFDRVGIKNKSLTHRKAAPGKKRKSNIFATIFFLIFFFLLMQRTPLAILFAGGGSRRYYGGSSGSGWGSGGGGFSGGGGGFSGGGASGGW